jgi:hypothetical protein
LFKGEGEGAEGDAEAAAESSGVEGGSFFALEKG